jgi:hypothetical protein
MNEMVGRLAKTLVHEDDDALCLQIELGNDQSVTLTYWKNGDTPRVSLWTGSGERSFMQANVDSFRAWLDQLGPVKPAA